MSDNNQLPLSFVSALPSSTNAAIAAAAAAATTATTTSANTFWSTLGQTFENYIRPQAATKPLATATISLQSSNDSENFSEKFLSRLNVSFF